MKKKILGICIVVLMLVALVSGCTENNSNNNGGTDTTPQTYTWTAKQFIDDMPMDLDWSDGLQLLHTTLKDGDTVIIQDTITEVSYDSVTDRTTITFEWTIGDGGPSAFSPVFEGNLTDTYSVGDNVEITATMKYVTFTDDSTGTSMTYELEIFEKTWTNKEEYIASQGGALPATSIEKVE